MMMSAIAGPSAPDLQSYAAGTKPPSGVIRSHQKFDETHRQIFTLQQKHFVVGGQHLALEREPEIAVYPGRFEFEILGWNIRLPYGKQDEIGRELIRKFLLLLGKAERLELNELEEADWAEIAKRVDYRRFSLDRAPFQLVEGLLWERSNNHCKVKWHDGQVEKLGGSLAARFNLLEVGEAFKAFGRFGSENRLVDLTSLTPVPSPTADEGERIWRSWPIKD